eukprot:5014733-Pleurochrysis_carterae.AAC.3
MGAPPPGIRSVVNAICVKTDALEEGIAIPLGCASGPEKRRTLLEASSGVRSAYSGGGPPVLGESGKMGWSVLCPRKKRFAEVHFGGEDDLALGWYPDVVGSGCRFAAPEVGADPGAGLHACLGGFFPVSNSYEDWDELGGPVVRFKMSTACEIA